MTAMDVPHAIPGTTAPLTWGEPDDGWPRLDIALRKQTQLRATAAPAPYAATVQKVKHATLGRT